MEGLAQYGDVVCHLSDYLELPDVVSLGRSCRRWADCLRRNEGMWMRLCGRLLGSAAPQQRAALGTQLGLAATQLSWRSFFIATYGSAVFTWGSGEGRTGHDQDEPIPEPRLLPSLSGVGIDFIGKTAEVGSVALAFGGTRVYLWGRRAASLTPFMLRASDICGNPYDRIIEASCGHDSGFILVFASGLTVAAHSVRYGDFKSRLLPSSWYNISRDIFGAHLLPGERAICSLGSQASSAGVLTNASRVLAWNMGRAINVLDGIRDHVPVFEPTAPPAPSEDECDEMDLLLHRLESLDYSDMPWPPVVRKPVAVQIIQPPADRTILKVRHGHLDWYCICDQRQLWQIPARLYGQEELSWVRVPGIEDDIKVLDVDAGSAHSAFCTLDGDAYTWGSNAFGMLGHGDEVTPDTNVRTPKRVEFFRALGKKVVAVAAGAYISWQGSYTLFLCSDNSLYRSGFLGLKEDAASLPKLIQTADLRGRHILSISAGEDWAGIVASASLTQ